MEMQVSRPQLADASQENRPNIQLLKRRDASLYALEALSTRVLSTYYPHVVGGKQANELPVKDAMVALSSGKSAVSQELYQLWLEKSCMTPMIEKKQRLWLASHPNNS